MTPQEERYFIIDMNMGRGLSSDELSKYLLERYEKEFEVLVETQGPSKSKDEQLKKISAIDSIVSSSGVTRKKVQQIAQAQARKRMLSRKEEALELLPNAIRREVVAAETRCASLFQKARDICEQHNMNVDIVNKHLKKGALGLKRLAISRHNSSGKIWPYKATYT